MDPPLTGRSAPVRSVRAQGDDPRAKNSGETAPAHQIKLRRGEVVQEYKQTAAPGPRRAMRLPFPRRSSRALRTNIPPWFSHSSAWTGDVDIWRALDTDERNCW